MRCTPASSQIKDGAISFAIRPMRAVELGIAVNLHNFMMGDSSLLREQPGRIFLGALRKSKTL
jgi:hypothetical protein